ncbi:MAG: hypothetical protein CMG55_00130 [Candidatus Marinimicrobia bacterium]|nr:hypothetical protein [Candidatus Neomarinimicrobiota bacterium]|tara:strand:+ start:3671 stop:4012 length:342 start_codon:yes stop_codon:yes gene_type:complete
MDHIIINLVEALKVIASVAIFFVWVVRYDNIKNEFEEYRLPTWTRDLVGILKISFAAMLQFSNQDLVKIGALGISLLMCAAVITHLKLKSNFRKYIASVAMLMISCFILFYTV